MEPSHRYMWKYAVQIWASTISFLKPIFVHMTEAIRTFIPAQVPHVVRTLNSSIGRIGRTCSNLKWFFGPDCAPYDLGGQSGSFRENEQETLCDGTESPGRPGTVPCAPTVQPDVRSESESAAPLAIRQVPARPPLLSAATT